MVQVVRAAVAAEAQLLEFLAAQEARALQTSMRQAHRKTTEAAEAVESTLAAQEAQEAAVLAQAAAQEQPERPILAVAVVAVAEDRAQAALEDQESSS
jgi:hypothetical protein